MNQILIDQQVVLEAQIDVKNISGTGNLNTPILNVPVVLKLRPLKNDHKDFGLHNLTASLFTSSKNIAQVKLSSVASVDISTHKIIHETPKHLYIEFQLNRFSLNEIEKRRIKDTQLKIEINCQISLFQNNVVYGFETGKIKIDFTVPQSQWIEKVNNKFGFLDYFLIEFPKGKKTVPHIWKKLERAENNFHQYDISGLFVNCRDIGSALDNHLKDALGKKSFAYSERWKRSYSKFSHYCSLPLHIEDLKGKSTAYAIDELKIFKHDCEHVLFLVKSLIKYAEELLAEE